MPKRKQPTDEQTEAEEAAEKQPHVLHMDGNWDYVIGCDESTVQDAVIYLPRNILGGDNWTA